ncbi:MAG: hypothetical protein AAB599_00505 [Patescibacteria group bacterium]|mgnify:CR=1 FL=1
MYIESKNRSGLELVARRRGHTQSKKGERNVINIADFEKCVKDARTVLADANRFYQRILAARQGSGHNQDELARAFQARNQAQERYQSAAFLLGYVRKAPELAERLRFTRWMVENGKLSDWNVTSDIKTGT